ncbi:MAG: MgtC/SapB family protein [Hyphomicrobiaceae bacterium]|nr:MgtC/SapB family protein [Hyphomicrobiaceae bacterium]
MSAIANINPPELLNSLVSFLAAFLLGTLIGAERQFRNRSAGLRTNVLVALGAAAFVDLGARLTGNAGAVHVTAYVVSGVGFLGAGTILREGGSVRGLNTAATLWSSAAVGALSGADLVVEALLLTLFVLAGNTLLRPLVNGINRLPFNERTSEARYQIHVTARSENADKLRDDLSDMLDEINYPARDIREYNRGNQFIELIATLTATAVEPRELDKLSERLAKKPAVAHATWSQRVMD